MRLQKKIFGDSLPQNLKYGSIPAFCRLSLTQKFCILQVGEFLPPNFMRGEVRICRKAGALQKMSANPHGKGGERNRKGVRLSPAYSYRPCRRRIHLSFAERERGFCSSSSFDAVTGFAGCPAGVLPQVQIGKSFGQIHPCFKL